MWSSLLMVVLGLLTILFVSYLLGLVLTVVGLGMYFFYRRLDRRSRAASGGS